MNLSPRLASSGCLVLLVASALLPQILQPLTSRIPIDSAGTQSGISVLQSLPFLLEPLPQVLVPLLGQRMWHSSSGQLSRDQCSEETLMMPRLMQQLQWQSSDLSLLL